MIKTICKFVPLIALMLLTASCGSSDGNSKVQTNTFAGSCVISGGVICIDYTGSGYTQSAAQDGCSSAKGQYDSQTCSVGNRVGSCVIVSGTKDENVNRYYSPHFTTETASTSCLTTGTINGIPQVFTAN